MTTATSDPTSTTARSGGYTVLARRYRSRDFDELIGQEAVAETLKNAIASGRTAHAYLFCGTRGVGKTSMARIFAKALNVTHAPEPPSEAEAVAAAILRGDDLDVIEIDGASNRGINEAREMIAGAGLSPTRCRYRIYIIDEVHMLTTPAFNALLKLMEEPPAHVKFILCTTDPQKVPATIQSRCQRFDFRAISTPRIAEQLTTVLEQEGITAQPDAIRRVAALGNGSMRDALSLLDRVIAGGQTEIAVADVERLLGLPDTALARAVIDAIVAGDPAAGLRAGAAFIAAGTSVELVLEALTGVFRDLLVLRTCGAESDLVDLAEDARAELAQLAAHFDPPGLVHQIALCDAVARNARGSATARALFDAAIVRMCCAEKLADVTALLAGGGAEKKKPELTAAAARPTAPPSAPRAAEPVRPPAPSAAPARAPDPAAAPAVTAAPVADDALWPAIETFARQSPRDQSRLQGFAFRSFDGRTLTLAAEAGRGGAAFLKAQAEPIAGMVQRATQRTVRVEIVVDEAPAGGAARAATTTAPRVNEALVAEARELKAVQDAIAIFDAVITDVMEWTPRGETPAPNPNSDEGA